MLYPLLPRPETHNPTFRRTSLQNTKLQPATLPLPTCTPLQSELLKIGLTGQVRLANHNEEKELVYQGPQFQFTFEDCLVRSSRVLPTHTSAQQENADRALIEITAEGSGGIYGEGSWAV